MEIVKNIYAVGVIDSDVRIFHGYQTPIGSSYNAYLIIDEKITLIDFVKAPFSEELAANIKKILNDRDIDYIICNHVEPDHSGALPLITKLYPKAVVYGTPKCQQGLKAYYPDSVYEFVTVKNGDTLSTGKYTFTFVPVPMVHWPDSMATYLSEEKILFSNDVLGQHIGTGARWDSEIELDMLLDRAGDYYANIVLPLGSQVQKVLDGVSKLDIKIVCNSHGVILQKYIGEMVGKYAQWSKNETDENRLVIVYDTMWQSTAKLAKRLHDEYSEKGFSVESICLSEKHHSYAMARLLEAKYILVGSPTLNNQIMPTVSAFLTYMKGLKPMNRIGRAFGSYGWSGESVGQINDILASCGFEMLEPVKTVWNV